MEPKYRKAYNAAFDTSLYVRQCDELMRRLGSAPAFRLAETPVFLPEELERRLVTSAKEIYAQLRKPEAIARMKEAIPARWNAPGMDALPSLTQVDFAIVREKDGS